jgi:hypothetical protein
MPDRRTQELIEVHVYLLSCWSTHSLLIWKNIEASCLVLVVTAVMQSCL